MLTDVVSSGASTLVSGSLNSTPNSAFRIEFYSNFVCDASGFGEGELYFGSTDVTTDRNGDALFFRSHPISVKPGKAVTATATDAAGNTSESRCVGKPPGSLSSR